MSTMFFLVITKHYNIFHVDFEEGVYTIMKDAVYQRLKRFKRITQTHLHRNIFEFPVLCIESCLIISSLPIIIC